MVLNHKVSNENLIKKELHIEYIKEILNDESSDTFIVSSHLRIGCYFWVYSALLLLSSITPTTSIDITNDICIKIKKFVLECWNPKDGGFSFDINHPTHIMATLYALLLLTILNEFDEIKKRRFRIVEMVLKFQNDDGSFNGTNSNLNDSRFIYAAVSILFLLRSIEKLQTKKVISWILRCQNPDGGFGSLPNSESHGAYTYCCIAGNMFYCILTNMSFDINSIALSILNADHLINKNKLYSWLVNRQDYLPISGFNGRPEKAPDICYSWWIGASLHILGWTNVINKNTLFRFIIECQAKQGGLANIPGDEPDLFHTFFGLAALCLLSDEFNTILKLDPKFISPTAQIQRLRKMISSESDDESIEL